MTLKVFQGHIRQLLCQNQSSLFVYGPILMKICMNANITKKYFFHKLFNVTFYVIEKFCDFLLDDLMDNHCPCFIKILTILF